METTKPQAHKLKVFFREARVLTPAEIETLPPEKRKELEESGDEGVWLEVTTSPTAITERKNRLCVQIGEDEDKDRGMWLDFFCPDERCYRHDVTELM